MRKQPTCPNCAGPLVCLPCEKLGREKAAKALRTRRQELGISLRTMAARLGKSPAYLHNFEMGKTPGHRMREAYLAELEKAKKARDDR